MRSEFQSHQFSDECDNPAGGHTFGCGFAIAWQNGPLGRGSDRIKPNGAFVEDVIAVALDRIEFYQQSRFACDENSRAIEHLKRALNELEARTSNREIRQVEGTHES